MKRLPPLWIACVPLVFLVALIACVVAVFGDETLSGASQIALLTATALCVSLGLWKRQLTWVDFEDVVRSRVGDIAVAMLILLLIGGLAGSWMVGGIVPTFIYYGLELLSPRWFLVSACIISAIVSVVIGSSWTTIATIGVALLGISHALGISEAWAAGAIISGAYFGDKMSPLSDTTILASSSTGVELFTHIRYMIYTTVPSFTITLIIFFFSGLSNDGLSIVEVNQYTEGLSRTFNISLWTLLVPLLTAFLISRRMSSLIVLFLSAMMAGTMALILQPHILSQIAGTGNENIASIIRGLALTFYGATNINTGDASLNELISTGGMAGMLNTIWLIICAMCFGAVMLASGMIQSITRVIISFVHNRLSLVTSTVFTGLFFNISTGDQFISIVLTGDMYRETYQQKGYELRLLSRTCEDAATVTSVLIPWNTCGMTQATILGVATLTYLPYCFFNIISPLMAILIAATGWKIRKVSNNNESK